METAIVRAQKEVDRLKTELHELRTEPDMTYRDSCFGQAEIEEKRYELMCAGNRLWALQLAANAPKNHGGYKLAYVATATR